MERIIELSDVIVYREEMDKYKVSIEHDSDKNTDIIYSYLLERLQIDKDENISDEEYSVTIKTYSIKPFEKYLEEHNLKKIGKEQIPQVVNELYEEKETELKKYIRGTMRKNFPDYDKNFTLKTSTEEIILEMFGDPEFSKNRIIIEIENYQRTIQN